MSTRFFGRTMLFVGLALLGAVGLRADDPAPKNPAAEVQDDAEVKEHAEKSADDGHKSDGHKPSGHDAGGHHEHIGEKGASKEILDPRGDLAIWTFAVFAILLAILWKFAWGPIMAGLEKREQGVKEQIRLAHESNDQARALLVQYEKKLAESQNEVRAIIEEARRDASHTKDEIVKAARDEAKAEKDRAIREIETATDQALKELAERSTNLAVDLAGKIVAQKLSASDHARLVDDAVKRFTNSPSQN